MNTLRTPRPNEFRRKTQAFRLAPLREEYFPDLDEDLDRPKQGGVALPNISPMPNQRAAEQTDPTGGTRGHFPQQSSSEVASGSYMPSIRATLPAENRKGHSEAVEANIRERANQIEQEAPMNLTPNATGANPAKPTVAVPSNKANAPLMHNPWALNRLSDVMGIFGLGFVFWFSLQLLSAVALAWGISPFLADLWILSWASAVCFVLLSDWVLWYRIRGRIYSAAARPALVVLVVSLICGAGSAGFRIVSSGVFQWGTSGPPAPL